MTATHTMEPVAPPARSSGIARALAAGRHVLVAYAQVGFGARPLAGALFLAATFVVPEHGLGGLLGLASAEAWARALGRPAAELRGGSHAFNGLLVGLALGLFFRFSWALVAVAAVAGLLTVLVGAAARHVAERTFGVPALSLAFVLVAWLTLLAARRFADLEVALEPAWAVDLGAGVLPGWLEVYLQSLGAVFFQLSVVSGALVLAGLLLISRWAVALSILGFAGGAAMYVGLGGAPADLSAHFVGLNFVLVAMAVGGIFVVLSPASLALALAAGALAALISAALLVALDPLTLPVLAMPFIATTTLLLFALARRGEAGGLRLVTGVPGTPEANLRRAAFQARRYPAPGVPLFHLPVMGRWLITQGVDGGVTHQGPWAHAWDLEVAGDDGLTFRGDGLSTADYHCWGAPVVAPAAGTVARVVSHHPDSAVGEVDAVHNWGNLVVLWHGADVYSVVCHLQQGSTTVREGEVVVQGQVLGKVGSSGRAPTPHLHFQVQRSPEMGSPTCPAELVHYAVAPADDGAGDGLTETYVGHGVPAQGETIRPVAVDEAARQAVALPLGSSLCWRVRRDDPKAPGEAHEERWESSIDALGGRHLRDDRGATLGLYSDPAYLTTMDYEGPGGSLLGLFHLAVPRLPFVRDAHLVWGDTADAGTFVSAPARLAQELARPFREVGAVRTTTSAVATDGGVRVTTELDWSEVLGAGGAQPDRLVTTWRPGRGPATLEAWRGATRLLRAEVCA